MCQNVYKFHKSSIKLNHFQIYTNFGIDINTFKKLQNTLRWIINYNFRHWIETFLAHNLHINYIFYRLKVRFRCATPLNHKKHIKYPLFTVIYQKHIATLAYAWWRCGVLNTSFRLKLENHLKKSTKYWPSALTMFKMGQALCIIKIE